MTDLAEISRSVEQCEQTHVDQEYPFCENYGCMSMRPLLDEVERLAYVVEVARRVLLGFGGGEAHLDVLRRAVARLDEPGPTRPEHPAHG